MDWQSVLTLGMAGVTGVGVPLLIYMSNRNENARRDAMKYQDKIREDQFSEVHRRMSHLDECMDEVQRQVNGQVASRQELLEHRAETTVIINRMRAAITEEMSVISARILRLEEPYFKRRKDGD